MVVCKIEGAPALMLKGRADFHETGDPSLMAPVLETLALVGVRSAISIGFANSVNPSLSPGAVVAVNDHIDFRGLNPLIGMGTDGAFLNMNEVYDKRQMRRLKYAAAGAGAQLHEGVLAWFSGPTFETVAEARAARILGADLVGMSIVPEAILAKRYRLPFAGVAVVLDFAAGVSGGAPDGDFASAPVAAALVQIKRLLRACHKK
jgi:purine-nucleoside phosphorylase